MTSRLILPKVQDHKITVRKKLSFCREFRITTILGDSFDFRNEELKGYYRKDNLGFCPPVDFCVNLVNHCSTIEMVLDARETEKMKVGKPYWFFIDLNPRDDFETLDRDLLISDVEHLQAIGELSIDDYSNWQKLEPLLPHKNSIPLIRGTIEVEL